MNTYQISYDNIDLGTDNVRARSIQGAVRQAKEILRMLGGEHVFYVAPIVKGEPDYEAQDGYRYKSRYASILA